MMHPLVVPELRELLEAGQTATLREFCEESQPAITAELMSGLTSDEVWAVLREVALPLRAEIFSHLDEDLQVEVFGSLNRIEMARLMADMPPDDRADLFKRLPEDRREAVLPALAQAEREDIRRLASYREGTAGAVMTSDYAALSPDLTVTQAIERLREIAPDRETIYYAYVVGEHRRLLGFVTLKDLIVARRDQRVQEIMHADLVSSPVDEDQEESAGKIQRYDLLALPVVDATGALVGIITHDDALDVITQEYTEDVEKLMAIAGSHATAAYMKSSPWVHFKNRAVWLVGLSLVGLVAGLVVQRFEGLLLQFGILAVFMPMLADTGGNTGSQAATLVVRALATSEITTRDALRVVVKELLVALPLGLLLAAVAFGRVVIFGGGASFPAGHSLVVVGAAIAVALGLQVVSATVIGALLPLGAAKAGWDPALVASPALTTVVDITGLLIYFGTVSLLLGL